MHLPYLPESFPSFDSSKFATNFTFATGQSNTTKLIQRNMWISFRTRPESLDELGDELVNMITRARADGWNVYCMGHEQQMLFMEMYYPNTSILWAIKQIHPFAGAAVSDIWRVAAVYAFGGFYLDDDSILSTPLEEVILPSDTLIVGRERAPYQDNCFFEALFICLVQSSREKTTWQLLAIYMAAVELYNGPSSLLRDTKCCREFLRTSPK